MRKLMTAGVLTLALAAAPVAALAKGHIAGGLVGAAVAGKHHRVAGAVVGGAVGHHMAKQKAAKQAAAAQPKR